MPPCYADGNLAAQLGAARRWVGPAIFMAQLALVCEQHRGARRTRARDVAVAPPRRQDRAQLGAARRLVGPAIFIAHLAPVRERHRGARRTRARDVALAPRRRRNVVKTMVFRVGVV